MRRGRGRAENLHAGSHRRSVFRMLAEPIIEPVHEKLTIEEIERRYPDQWVVIVDIEDDRPRRLLVAGVVVAHGPSRQALRPISQGYRDCALRWTGKHTPVFDAWRA